MPREKRSRTKWSGTSSTQPFDLAAVAGDLNGAECHVCESVAAYRVELSQGPAGENAVELGSAVFLCPACFELVSTKNNIELSARFNEGSTEEIAKVAARMIEGQLGSVRLAH